MGTVLDGQLDKRTWENLEVRKMVRGRFFGMRTDKEMSLKARRV